MLWTWRRIDFYESNLADISVTVRWWGRVLYHNYINEIIDSILLFVSASCRRKRL